MLLDFIKFAHPAEVISTDDHVAVFVFGQGFFVQTAQLGEFTQLDVCVTLRPFAHGFELVFNAGTTVVEFGLVD